MPSVFSTSVEHIRLEILVGNLEFRTRKQPTLPKSFVSFTKIEVMYKEIWKYVEEKSFIRNESQERFLIIFLSYNLPLTTFLFRSFLKCSNKLTKLFGLWKIFHSKLYLNTNVFCILTDNLIFYHIHKTMTSWKRAY